MSKSIIIVDDNPRGIASTTWAIKSAYPEIDLHTHTTVKDFSRSLDTYTGDAPLLFIFDNMLPYSFEQDEPDEGYDVMKGARYCIGLVRKYPALKETPIIVFSATPSRLVDVGGQEDVSVFHKTSDDALLTYIENYLSSKGIEKMARSKLSSFIANHWEWLIAILIAIVGIIIAI